MTKNCPKCGHPMTPIYTYSTKDKKIVRKIHAYICTKCSYEQLA